MLVDVFEKLNFTLANIDRLLYDLIRSGCR